MMPYSEILQHGHWEAFLDYLWQHTDCDKRSGHLSAPAWSHAVRGSEDERLMLLFSENEELLSEQLSSYFDHLAKQHPKGCCLRCNRIFTSTALLDCQLCGWDFESASRGEVSPSAIEVNEHLNAKYIDRILSLLQATSHFERLDREAKWWSAEVERMEGAEMPIRKELEDRQAAFEVAAHRKISLEQRFQMQSDQYRQLELMLKNAEALFLAFDDRQPEQTLWLNLKGYMLHVVARPVVKFPIDLIMGLQKTSDGPPVKTINKTSSFIFIRENQWVPVSKNEWKVDLAEIAKGKIAGDFYINCFSNLHKKDCLTSIHYDIKKLTFF